ncbi:putative Ciliary dynein heavy chain [Operophtera brumata]|uniref:Putative Ciliary dynein heavy chain n=1 Tax=Operophtera brumata TaxID=104452 RepID=A0A0L7LBH3_OPEBR|nr:putative Ciliary dynein heavy chain [Operophtera brumata]
MADEGGEALPVAEAPAAETDGHAEDVAQTTVKISNITSSMAPSVYSRMIVGDETVDVDRTALEAILEVGTRIQDIQKKSRISMSAQQRFLLENAAAILNRTIEYVLDGVYDADSNIEVLDSAMIEGGRNCFVLCDALLPTLKMESGRYIYQQKGRMERTYISDAATIRTEGACDYFLVFIDMNQETENVVSGIYKTMKSVYIPALQACQAWGDINPPNPNKTKTDLDCCTRFKINLMLYEDELSDPDKMKLAISKTKVLEEICNYVKQWMKQITMLCLNLYTFYRECYNEAQKEMMEAADERPFDCSEMYIVDLFQTYITYYVLNKTTLEGIEEYAANFNKLFKSISTKTYNALDHRRPDFDKDYKTYKDNIANQESVNKCPTTEIALRLLKRFETLKLGCLYLEDQYYDLISTYTAEIEALRDRYNEERENPELPRNMPPVAGRVMWIRFYDNNIKRPMEIFVGIREVIEHMMFQTVLKL